MGSANEYTAVFDPVFGDFLVVNFPVLASLRLLISHLFCFTLKVLGELFSSVFENEDLPTPLHPLQGGLATRLIKPPALLSSLRPLPQKPGSSSSQVTVYV